MNAVILLAVSISIIVHFVGLLGVISILHFNRKIIMAKVSELQPRLDALSAQLSKVQTEVTNGAASLRDEIARLREQIENSSDPDLPAAVESTLAAMEATVDQIDALNPDNTDVTDETDNPSPV